MSEYEGNLQAACVRYIRNELKLPLGTFFSIPNEGKRDPRFASRLLAQGLVAGMPDLVLLANRKAVFFELKAKGGKLSKRQEYVIENLRTAGYEVHVIDEFDEFQKIVDLELTK